MKEGVTYSIKRWHLIVAMLVIFAIGYAVGQQMVYENNIVIPLPRG